jgi:hypothetical protein
MNNKYSLRCIGIDVNDLDKATNIHTINIYVKLEVPAKIVISSPWEALNYLSNMRQTKASKLCSHSDLRLQDTDS